MKKIIIATQNRDKFTEMNAFLGGLDWEILPAYDFPGIPEVTEDGQSLEDNSLKKAKTVSDFTGYPSMADDTGLFVEALNGEPGIYSGRFAGKGCSYQDNVRKLLALMKGIPLQQRGAIFRTIITLFFPRRAYQQAVGEVKGIITEAARGHGDFGYDPIFQPLGYEKVFSEMTLEEKNKISHRGKALFTVRRLLSL